jgi:hypothetical protein
MVASGGTIKMVLTEYANLGDLLADMTSNIVADHRRAERYIDYGAEIDLLCEVMDAVRALPGLDRAPDGANTFDADITAAVARYRHNRTVHH